jgi:hypothetical protein
MSSSPHSNSDISLRDILQYGARYLAVLWSHRILLPLFCIPFLLWYGYQYLRTGPQYAGHLTFILNEDDTKSSGFSGLLGSLGIVGGGAGEYNLDKILDLSRTLLIVKRILLEQETINGIHDFIGNHLIQAYDYDKRWKRKMPNLVGLRFEHDSLPAFSREQLRILKILHKDLIGNPAQRQPGILRSSYSESSGIMSLQISTPSEELSIAILNRMFDKLSAYYIETATDKQQHTLDKLELRVDSLRRELSSREYQLAQFDDANRGLISERSRVRRDQLQRELSMFSLMYAEAVKNREIADFSLKNRTPFIRVVDAPFAPLTLIRPVWWRQLLLALALGGICWGLFIVGRQVFQDIMHEETT